MPNPLSQRAPGLGQDLARCYQCGKCTAGCPIARGMDIPPHQVVGLLRLGQVEVLSQAESLWLCVGCGACWVRCPNGIHVGELVDALAKACRQFPGEDRGKTSQNFTSFFWSTSGVAGVFTNLDFLPAIKSSPVACSKICRLPFGFCGEAKFRFSHRGRLPVGVPCVSVGSFVYSRSARYAVQKPARPLRFEGACC